MRVPKCIGGEDAVLGLGVVSCLDARWGDGPGVGFEARCEKRSVATASMRRRVMMSLH
jgi:hypothetical protein